MTKRLDLYDWPKEPREIAEQMYRIARRLILTARLFREKARTAEKGSYDEGCCRGTAEASRAAARGILGLIREGRDYDVWYHRKMVREAVAHSIEAGAGKPTSLGGHLYDLLMVRGTGLDQPEFDEKEFLAPVEK